MNKLLLRFVIIFLLLTLSPWYYLLEVPVISYVIDIIYQAEVAIVGFFNSHLFHVKETLNENGGGSGDTSFAWAQFYTFLIVSLIGSIVWTVAVMKKSQQHSTLSFWTGNLVRYYLASVSLGYGIIKLFALQMPFPNLSQLATPLGDFLPMRLSWMFFGYSTSYQVFSGVVETLVAILLLNRKTVTFGALLAVAVFANVFMLNMSYDVPVKLFSMQLMIFSIFLVARDGKRIISFFFLNKDTQPTALYLVYFTKKWQRISRIIFKIVFVVFFAVLPFYDSWSRYKQLSTTEAVQPIKVGMYNIKSVVKNNDSIAISFIDTISWKDFIFDKGGMGSIKTSDSLFRQVYGRGYFVYEPDSITKTIQFKKFKSDSMSLFTMNYQIVNDQNMVLFGKIGSDSMRFELERNNKHFQLTDRPFHWISESNR